MENLTTSYNSRIWNVNIRTSSFLSGEYSIWYIIMCLIDDHIILCNFIWKAKNQFIPNTTSNIYQKPIFRGCQKYNIYDQYICDMRMVIE